MTDEQYEDAAFDISLDPIGAARKIATQAAEIVALRAQVEAADALQETLEWMSDAITSNITENCIDQDRIILDGVPHTGPVVDFSMNVIRGLRDIAEKALAAYRAARQTDTKSDEAP